MKKKILLLGPKWRNKKIKKILKNTNHVYLTNKKINSKFIKKKKINIIVCSGYPYLVKQKLINEVDLAINLHISYLPYGRGIMPNVWSFVENYPSGITIHQLSEKFDTGNILMQKKIKFKKVTELTLKKIHDILIKELEDFFLKNCNNLFDNEFSTYPQNKFIKYNRYHNREESENLMLNFKKKWHTKIKEIIKFKKKNKLLINKYVKK